jgi:alginate O-acetyltransferase complex protein AlgI
MLFQDTFFLLFLFPIFYFVYVALNKIAAKKWTLIVGSVAFYSWGEPLFVPVVLASSLFDYALSLCLRETADDGRRRLLVAAGVVGNLAILIFYKYTDFLISNFNAASSALAGPLLPLAHVALPIGVSFVVFEKITYLVDTYRRTTPPTSSFLDYCLFVFFFPKLLAGPILKNKEMQGQIADPAPVLFADFFDGFLRFARGIAKKLLIADTVGAFADRVFSADTGSLGPGSAWLGLICFTLQIYFDFSGYSDMAIGLARMLGFRLKENFDMPYVARSLTEFWRRWHVSLSTWIRDYLYVPLGGNRRGTVRTFANLWICFLASGLWHGAGWNYVLWGAYQGLFLTLDRLVLIRWMERAGALVANAVTLVVIMIGWAIFRSTSLEHLSGFLGALAAVPRQAAAVDMPPDVPFAVTVGALVCLFPATPLFAPLQRAYAAHRALRGLTAAVLIGLYVLACARATSIPFKPFIYFRF